MNYVSLFSGIEAATVAWKPLGWEAQWYSEIEPYCRQLLEEKYPSTPNVGDVREIYKKARKLVGKHGQPQLVIGGSPCQSFSIAGERRGLADPRGDLTLEYLRLVGRLRPRWAVWENVPGVLSIDGGRTFGAILGILGQLGYGFAYRVLDAQHFGVPQRRRRVFLVGCLGDWRSAAAVLFEPESLRRDTPASGEARPEIAIDVAASLRSRGPDSGTRYDAEVGLVAYTVHGENSSAMTGNGNAALAFETEKARSLDQNGGDVRGNQGGNLVMDQRVYARQTGVGWFTEDDKASISHRVYKDQDGILYDPNGGTAPALRAEGHDASEDETGRRALVFSERGRPAGRTLNSQEELSYALCNPGDGGRGDQNNLVEVSDGHSAVRRLTPTECERLQGFPDGYTAIEYKGKPAADAPRFRALGNSMAVPVVRWIGQRIQEVENELAANQPGRS